LQLLRSPRNAVGERTDWNLGAGRGAAIRSTTVPPDVGLRYGGGADLSQPPSLPGPAARAGAELQPAAGHRHLHAIPRRLADRHDQEVVKGGRSARRSRVVGRSPRRLSFNAWQSDACLTLESPRPGAMDDWTEVQ